MVSANRKATESSRILAQVLALSTGRPLRPVDPEIARATVAQMRAGDPESARLHLESMKRVLARTEPEFAA